MQRISSLWTGVCLAALLLEPAARAGGETSLRKGVTVHLNNKAFSLEKAPASFPADQKTLIEDYQDYALAQGLVAVCDAEVPIVIFTAGAPAESQKLLQRSEKLLASFHARLGKPRKTDPPAIFVLKKSRQYAPLVDSLVARHPYLAGWAAQARNLSGFFLLQPSVAVILDDGVGQQEYQLENQVLHQLVHLELGAQFGPQPFWLSEGISWVFEEEITKAIYAFCYRDGFVFAGEHEGWRDEVKRLVQKKQFPGLDQVCQGGRSSFDRSRALGSYGLATYFLREKAEALRGVLESYAKEHREHLGQDPVQELNAVRQKELIQAKLGADFEDEARKYLLASKGKN